MLQSQPTDLSRQQTFLCAGFLQWKIDTNVLQCLARHPQRLSEATAGLDLLTAHIRKLDARALQGDAEWKELGRRKGTGLLLFLLQPDDVFLKRKLRAQ